MTVASGWSQFHHGPNPSPASTSQQITRLRSQSTATGPPIRSLSASAVVKPRSNTQSSSMTADVSSFSSGARSFSGISENDLDLTTIPDPRSRSITPSNMDGASTPQQQHPELSDEVATLSSKLVQAINHQTTLDDSLSETQAELERAREQIRSMEVQLDKQREMIAEEKRLRLEAEHEKKRIEQELENLTTELFEEANNMVISAKEESRKEQDVVQRKNDLLKAQLADTEGLLKSQQEQLIELKRVMEQMNADRDDQTATTTPSSPGYSKFDAREDDTPTSEIGSQSGLSDLITPSYPTSFTHLLQPILRTDINAYQDFANLCETSRRAASRPPSGTHPTLGLGLIGSSVSAASVGIHSSASTASLSSAGSPAASSTFSPQTPNTPASAHSVAPSLPIPPLKDTKFYKRVLAEDIEPTLRLDSAPGLSWLARRSVIAAMSDGSLVVEPVPTTGTYAMLSKPQFYPCSLCGESRKDDQYLRRYRFRTSENSSSQRYPLCRYCLNRVRATCDFLGFLRIVKDGHWRTDDDDSEKAAWEESVRLRENMFWTRIGGGVRPIMQGFQAHTHSVVEKSPRPSRDENVLPLPDSRAGSIRDEKVDQDQAQEDEVTDTTTLDDEDKSDEFETPSEELTPEASLTTVPDARQEAEEEQEEEQTTTKDIAPVEETLRSRQDEVKTIPRPPRTPSPSDSNRLSSQSLTPKSLKSNKNISLDIPSSP